MSVLDKPMRYLDVQADSRRGWTVALDGEVLLTRPTKREALQVARALGGRKEWQAYVVLVRAHRPGGGFLLYGI